MNTITEPWGAFPESLIQKILRTPVAIGLGRGKYWRHFLYQIWRNFGNSSKVDIMYYGLRMRFDSKDPLDRKMLFRSGMRDEAELLFLKKFADANTTFIDIGAHYGYYSLQAISLGYSSVVAIEPDPNVFKNLKFHVDANKLIETVNCFMVGASNTSGELHLNLENASLRNTASTNTIKVPVRPISLVLEQAAYKRIHAFKIDIEGHEDKALIPWLESLSDASLPKAAVVEICNSERWEDDVIAYMLRRGYVEEFRTRSNACLKRVCA